MLLEDGFSTLLSFSLNPSVRLEEITVKPPGLDGDGVIPVTTMRNIEYRTNATKKLKSLTEGSATVAYDPAVYDDMEAMLNVNQEITVTFPDGSTVTFWGAVTNFEPGDNSEGERPTAEITINPTNRDNDKVEQKPVYAAAA